MSLRTTLCPAVALAVLLGCSPGEESAPVAAESAGVTSAADEYPTPGGAWGVERSDFEALLARAQAEDLAARPIGERMTGFGRAFVGAPYVAHTLEMPGDERLVVNLKELDCVTLIENAMALSFAMRAGGTPSFERFLRELETIRYRGGTLDGYTSRLHYFSDWLVDAERKGLARNITRELGGEPYREPVDFMTRNADRYRQLAADPSLVAAMREVERRLDDAELFWIPQDRIAAVEEGIREGDIIGITTAVAGLDISHTGLATWVDGRLHLLHAPDVGQPVEVSTRPLAERIRANRMQTGIMVARPLERG